MSPEINRRIFERKGGTRTSMHKYKFSLIKKIFQPLIYIEIFIF